jgi:peptide/nickel transport system permease protein
MRRRVPLIVGAAVCAALLGVALLSAVWTPWPVAEIAVTARLQGPSPQHWLGTDQLGRDVLSQLMVGARTSLLVAVLAVLLGAGLGIPLGLLASARGGWSDGLVMRVADLVFAFPAVLTAILLAATRGPSTMNAVLAIGLFNVPVFAIVTRNAALSLWRREFVLAARLAGARRTRIAVEHILPNLGGLLVVQATIQFALAIPAEAGLSYLGLGTPPPTPSWGRMLNDAQTLLYSAPRLALLPGAAIALAVLGLNLLGDGLRDRLDPRLARAEHPA